jgi:hypothetical protein
VIESFYTAKIAGQFESSMTWYSTQAIHRALKRINTPEALSIVGKYQNPDTLSDRHMRTFITGWLTHERETKSQQ